MHIHLYYNYDLAYFRGGFTKKSILKWNRTIFGYFRDRHDQTRKKRVFTVHEHYPLRSLLLALDSNRNLSKELAMSRIKWWSRHFDPLSQFFLPSVQGKMSFHRLWLCCCFKENQKTARWFHWKPLGHWKLKNWKWKSKRLVTQWW